MYKTAFDFGIVGVRSSPQPTGYGLRADIKALIEISLGFDVLENAEPVAPERSVYCPDCGGKMHYRYSVLPYMLIDYNDGG